MTSKDGEMVAFYHQKWDTPENPTLQPLLVVEVHFDSY
jgi:hypothetical protein